MSTGKKKQERKNIIELLSTKENDKSPAADGTESWRFVIGKEKVKKASYTKNQARGLFYRLRFSFNTSLHPYHQASAAFAVYPSQEDLSRGLL